MLWVFLIIYLSIRIGDDEVQAIIDAQLSDVGSFGVRIPKTQEKLEKEAAEKNIKSFKMKESIEVNEDSEITTLSSDIQETTLEDEEETTTQTIIEENIKDISDTQNTSEIVSSSGDDLVLSEEIVDIKEVDEPMKKLKKVKKLKKAKE